MSDTLLPLNPLAVGASLPQFNLLDKDGNSITNDHFAGKNWILYFYPRASTPGCTLQACSLRDHKPLLPVMGVSPDQPQALAKFANKQSLDFLLTGDIDAEFATQCGIFAKKMFMGVTKNRIHRIGFLISDKGRVLYVFEGFKTGKFAQVVNEKIKELDLH